MEKPMRGPEPMMFVLGVTYPWTPGLIMPSGGGGKEYMKFNWSQQSDTGSTQLVRRWVGLKSGNASIRLGPFHYCSTCVVTKLLTKTHTSWIWRLNTTTLYRKIGAFEVVCVYPRPCLITTDHPCSAAMSRDITQPCILATFSFNGRRSLRFAALSLGSF